MTETVKEHHQGEPVFGGRETTPYLAAVLLGTVGTADRRGGYGACQLGVGAQHGIRLPRARRAQFADAWR